MPKQRTFPWCSLQSGRQFPCCAKQKQPGRAAGNKAGPQGRWTGGIYFQLAGRWRGCPWWTASGERPGVGHQWTRPSVRQPRERSPADTGLSPLLWPQFVNFAKTKQCICTVHCKAGAKLNAGVFGGGKETCQARMGIYTSKSSLVSVWVQGWTWAWTLAVMPAAIRLCNLQISVNFHILCASLKSDASCQKTGRPAPHDHWVQLGPDSSSSEGATVVQPWSKPEQPKAMDSVFQGEHHPPRLGDFPWVCFTTGGTPYLVDIS